MRPSPAQQAWSFALLKVQDTERGLVAGDVHYIINARWLSKWQASVGYASELEHAIAAKKLSGDPVDLAAPGLAVGGAGADDALPPVMDSIDNSSLVREGGLADVSTAGDEGASGPSGPSLRTSLIPGHDYHIIGQQAWDMLVAWYGGGPAIRRIVRADPDSGDLRVALYPEAPPAAAEPVTPVADEDSDVDVEGPPGVAKLTYKGLNPLPISITLGQCGACMAPATKLCSKCRAVKYCTAVCQRGHWAWHKLECGSEIHSRFGLVGLVVRAPAPHLCVCVCVF